VVENGGYEQIDSGGAASEDIAQSGGTLALDGGTASDDKVQSGGLFVFAGNLASNLTVSSGTVMHTTVLSGVTISSGANELFAGATVLSGVTLSLASGAAAESLTVAKGGTLIGLGDLFAENNVAGSVSEVTIAAGAGLEVVSGGSAKAVTVSSGGIEYVRASGSTTGTVVSDGGHQMVSSGGVASATTVLSGGRDYIYAGGVARGLALIAGGVAIDNGEVLIAGAATLAGTLSGSGAVVETGGGNLLLSDSGAPFNGRATISGGTIELATAHALGTGYVQFVEPSSGSAMLLIAAPDAPAAGGMFANVISNFNGASEDIDLRSIAFVAGASATVVGSTLVLTEADKTYKFKLAGSVAGAYSVTSDGHGGTLIDPPASDSDVARFAHAAAAFAPSNAAKTALVSSGSAPGYVPFLHSMASDASGRI